MKHLTNLLLVLLISFTSNAQSYFNPDDTTVTRGDLETNVYLQDTTANAVVLYEFGNSFVDKNTFKLKTKIKKKLKILNRNGFDKATETIYLYNNSNRKEKVYDIIATTHNLENGEVTTTKLSESQIFEERYNDKYTIVKFTFPNIKEGSVITYSYTIESPFMFKYKEWEFQDDIPKMYSIYRTSIPGNWEYHIRLVGYLKLFHTEQSVANNCLVVGSGGTANCLNTVYVMKDIPAFIEEDYMTTKENYLSRIEYELKTFRGFDGRVDNITKSWKAVHKELKFDKNFGRQLGKSSHVKDLLDSSISNEKDGLKKATAIYHYVQENYTWNGNYGIYGEASVKDLVKNKSGKVSEINMLLYNLLSEEGIAVKPVLLSTRDNGLATKLFPVLSDFNYFIVHVTIDGQNYLLDATDDYLTFGQLPFRCLNQYARLLDFKGISQWIEIAPEELSTIQHRADLTLNADQSISGSVNTTATGYKALYLKKRFFSTNTEDYLEDFKNKYPNIEILEHHVETEDKTSTNFSESFNINVASDQINDKLYINPFLFKFFTENPFKLQERTYPIDFGYKDTYLYTMKINFDENYEVLETPTDLNMGLPNKKGSLLFTTKTDGNSVIIYFKFNFTEAVYDPVYYDGLKQFMSTIVDVQKNSLIVLNKKK